MASYQVMSWNGIPTGVRATDPDGQARVELSPRFQAVIDDIATRTGITEGKDYLADWGWSDPEERSGSAGEVAGQVAAEVEDAYPLGRLGDLRRELVSRLGTGGTGPESTQGSH